MSKGIERASAAEEREKVRMKRKRVQWRERRNNYEKTIDMISKYWEDIDHEENKAANVCGAQLCTHLYERI